tara:strand:- start:59 stop:433 length:375 start_codon:yes stop_codon:yes gene_type:complete
MNKPTYMWWNLSSFNTREDEEAAVFPDSVIMAACEETPPEIKIAVERCFLGEAFDEATDEIKADALVLNAIFWVMNQTGYEDYLGILETYSMPDRYHAAFRVMEGESSKSDFDNAEWEARYQQS